MLKTWREWEAAEVVSSGCGWGRRQRRRWAIGTVHKARWVLEDSISKPMSWMATQERWRMDGILRPFEWINQNSRRNTKKTSYDVCFRIHHTVTCFTMSLYGATGGWHPHIRAEQEKKRRSWTIMCFVTSTPSPSHICDEFAALIHCFVIQKELQKLDLVNRDSNQGHRHSCQLQLSKFFWMLTLKLPNHQWTWTRSQFWTSRCSMNNHHANTDNDVETNNKRSIDFESWVVFFYHCHTVFCIVWSDSTSNKKLKASKKQEQTCPSHAIDRHFHRTQFRSVRWYARLWVFREEWELSFRIQKNEKIISWNAWKAVQQSGVETDAVADEQERFEK